MNIKNRILNLAIVGIASVLCLGSVPAVQAQTDTNALPTTPQSFLTTVQGYFTSFNTNLSTFAKTNEVDIWTGADYVQGVNIANELGANYTFYKTFAFDEVTRNAGIAGTILSQQAGLSYDRVIYDVKVIAYVDAGYDFYNKRLFVPIGARFLKGLTENTFFGVGIEEAITKKGVSNPTISALVGFNF